MERQSRLPQMVHMFAFCAVSANVRVRCDFALRNVWQIGRDVEREGAELFHVDASASAEVVIQVGDKGPPYNLHLRRI